MLNSVSASGASSGAATVPEAQPVAAVPAAAKPATTGEDTVRISATAQEAKQPTAAQVRLLHAKGQSIPQIASKLQITAHAVQVIWVRPPQRRRNRKGSDHGLCWRGLTERGRTCRASLQSR